MDIKISLIILELHACKLKGKKNNKNCWHKMEQRLIRSTDY